MSEFPHVVVFDESTAEDDAAENLANRLQERGINSPLVISSRFGRRLADRIKGINEPEAPARDANQQWAAELGSRAKRAGADAVVAVGGGRCIDVGKLAAVRAGVTIVAVPTQLSHDGICSPVAVVPNEEAKPESVGAIPPRLVFVSIPTLADAPVASVRAGLGDLIANPFALRDWALAAEHGLDTIDQRAWDLSVESFGLIKGHLDVDPTEAAKDPVFLRELADALVLSGVAMTYVGTSRPASGAEHEISHAIDESFRGRALHGAQVAFGCIVSVALYGEDPHAFRAQLARIGLPEHPADLDLDESDMVDLLLMAPDTRPGRFTILEDADLDRAKATALVRRIWPDLPNP
ncbi:MAG: iron-containing alcohol dehydrogenase [Actinomycetota bacterium]|nr:iron-containing alcohol dehydrogenase [Actinomycetota bacterium]